jgi:ketosteroid isomerase-like protein
MQYPRIAVALVSLSLAACGADAVDSQVADATVSPDEQALMDVAVYWATHYNEHHASMVAQTYADDAWVLSAAGGMIEGREDIEADLTSQMANSPMVSLPEGADILIFGDMATAMGTYTVETSPEGAEAMAWSGTYLNLMTKASGDWKIMGTITNYDAARPEGWNWNEAGDPPADEGTMGDVTDYFATHWNMGHPSMVADMYEDDAMVSFSDSPIVEGRAAVEAALAERIASGAQITIHDVATLPLTDGWAVDGGWYQLDAADGSGPIRMGTYIHLMRQQDDGSWKIHRGLTNTQPAPAM